MKRRLVLLLLLLLSLGGCGEKPPAPPPPKGEAITGSIAFLGDSDQPDSLLQPIWAGIAEYGSANARAYAAFAPADDSKQARLDAIAQAVKAGACIVVCPGGEFGETVASAQDAFPDTKFLLLDATAESDMTVPLAANTHSLRFAEEQCGYLAGYGAVMEGYTKLGFFGGSESPAIVRYGYGFVQGADAAAQEQKTKLTIHYTYGDPLAPAEESRAHLEDWYAQGSELLFVCGAVSPAELEAALAQKGRLICADIDRNHPGLGDTAARFPDYNPFVASAVKDTKAATRDALALFFDGAWESIGGRESTLGLRAGAYLGLSTEQGAWNFRRFTQEQYARVLAAIGDGSVQVSGDSTIEPTVSANSSVNYIR